MSRLLGIYPAAWRERYAAEVEELLIARPPTLRDRLDLVRGAIDAWAHPQVRRATGVPAHDGLGPRAGGAVAILGGALFAASGWRIASSHAIGPDGYRDNGIAIPLLVLGMLLTAIAALVLCAEPGPRRAAGLAIGGSILTMLPWPILIIGFFTYAAATLALGVLLIARRRVMGLALVAIGVVLPNFNTETELALAAVPVGILWIVFGLAYRPSPVKVPAGGTPGSGPVNDRRVASAVARDG